MTEDHPHQKPDEVLPLVEFARCIPSADGGTLADHLPAALRTPWSPLEQPDLDPWLTVAVRTVGTRLGLLRETLTCLAAQTDQAFDVLLLVHAFDGGVLDATGEVLADFDEVFSRKVTIRQVIGGRRGVPLNVAIEEAAGEYLAFVDDDDFVTAHWVQSFRRGAEAAPGRVVRATVADLPVRALTDPDLVADHETLGGPVFTHPTHFDLADHFRVNQTPICTIALPLAPLRVLRVTVGDQLRVLEDWDLLLQVAPLLGVHCVPEVTSVYRRWERTDPASGYVARSLWQATHEDVLARAGDRPVLLPSGSAATIGEAWLAYGDYASMRKALDDRARSVEFFEEVAEERIRAADYWEALARERIEAADNFARMAREQEHQIKELRGVLEHQRAVSEHLSRYRRKDGGVRRDRRPETAPGSDESGGRDDPADLV